MMTGTLPPDQRPLPRSQQERVVSLIDRYKQKHGMSDVEILRRCGIRHNSFLTKLRDGSLTLTPRMFKRLRPIIEEIARWKQ